MSQVTSPLPGLLQVSQMRVDSNQTAFDRWVTNGGPARFELLSPLAEVLSQGPAPPPNLELAIEPLRWLLQEARKGGLSCDENGFMDPDFSARANHDLGFWATPREGERIVFEIDMLLILAATCGHVWTSRERVRLTDCGSIVVKNPHILWKEAADAFLAVPQIPSHFELWVIVLAWLLSDRAISDDLDAPLQEVIDKHAKNGEFNDPESELPSIFGAFYTLCRSLSMLDLSIDPPKPVLTPMGRASAIRALRAAIVHNEHLR